MQLKTIKDKIIDDEKIIDDDKIIANNKRYKTKMKGGWWKCPEIPATSNDHFKQGPQAYQPV